MPKKQESSEEDYDELDDFTSENVYPEDPLLTEPNQQSEIMIKNIEQKQNEENSSNYQSENRNTKKKTTRKIKYPKVTFYINETQYPVVKGVGKKIFKWKLTNE